MMDLLNSLLELTQSIAIVYIAYSLRKHRQEDNILRKRNSVL